MKRKTQIVATLPDHVVSEITKYSNEISLTKSEYLALIAKKWFADGCPATTPEEQAMRNFLEEASANHRGGPKMKFKTDEKGKSLLEIKNVVLKNIPGQLR